MKYKFLVDHVDKGEMGLQCVASERIVADMFANNLKRISFVEKGRMAKMC